MDKRVIRGRKGKEELKRYIDDIQKEKGNYVYVEGLDKEFYGEMVDIFYNVKYKGFELDVEDFDVIVIEMKKEEMMKSLAKKTKEMLVHLYKLKENVYKVPRFLVDDEVRKEQREEVDIEIRMIDVFEGIVVVYWRNTENGEWKVKKVILQEFLAYARKMFD